jgi:adenylate kinase family enzyme
MVFTKKPLSQLDFQLPINVNIQIDRDTEYIQERGVYMCIGVVKDIFKWLYIFPKQTIVLNLDKWDTNNPLLITGSSGDGKTTLAKKIAKEYDAIIIHTDAILLRLCCSKDVLIKNYHSLLFENDEYMIDAEYLKAHEYLPYNTSNTRIIKSIEETREYTIDYIDWIGKYMLDNYPDKLYIIEGNDICALELEYLYNKPLILLGSSRLLSFYRRIRRNVVDEHKGLMYSIHRQIVKYNKVFRRLDRRKEYVYSKLKHYEKK